MRLWPRACVACKPTPSSYKTCSIRVQRFLRACTMHDTHGKAALSGRLFTGLQIGLDSPQPFSSWSTVRIWHRLRLRQRDGLLMEAGGGWCSILIMFPSLNTAPILATGRLYGLFKFAVAFAQALLLFTVYMWGFVLCFHSHRLPRGCAGLP